MHRIAYRAIDEVCRCDYEEQPRVIEGWLAAKTTQHIQFWIANKDCYAVIAEDDFGEAAGFAMMHRDGEVQQLYVLPEYLGQGFGKAMLGHLEHAASFSGVNVMTTFSTLTALPFYAHQGYVSAGQTISESDSVEGEYPLCKVL